MKKKSNQNMAVKITMTIFFIIGAIFFAVGIAMCISTFTSEKVETTGIISEIETYRSGDEYRHKVYIEYEVDGKVYNSLLNNYMSNYYEGKEIDIYYNPDFPEKIGTRAGDTLVFIFPTLGLIFMMVGLIYFFIIIAKKNKTKKLKATGHLIHAKYQEIVINTSYSVNGRHPYNIICEWDNLDDNKKYIFKSDNIWFNPEVIISQKNIKTFPVYINLEKISEYYVDIDELEENVIDLT